MHRKQEINFQPISYARGAKQHNQNRVSEDALVSSNSISIHRHILYMYFQPACRFVVKSP